MRPFACLAGVLLGVVLAGEALACSCIPRSIEGTLAYGDVVFRGREIAQYYVPPDRTNRWSTGEAVSVFEVYEAWRGVETRTIAISTGSFGSSCSITESLGSDELVVMVLNAPPGRLPSVSVCSRPIPASELRRELEALGLGYRPDPPSARGWFTGTAFELTALP